MVKPTATVIVKKYFEASPEKVFDAWLDPEKARKFFFATPTGQMVKAEIDPRVEGEFLFVDRRDGEDIEHQGTYLEISKPRQIVFTFYVPKYQKDTESTEVALDFIKKGAGCELILTHSGVWLDYEELTKKGWEMILESLGKTLDIKE